MRSRLREIAEGLATITVATLLGLFLNGAFEVHTTWEPTQTLLWVLFVVASATGALFIILQVLRGVVLAIMERRLRMVERAIVLERTAGEIMVVEHAKALGMNDRLISRWMSTHNRLLGCTPEHAILAGRIDQVLDVLEGSAAGRPSTPYGVEP